MVKIKKWFLHNPLLKLVSLGLAFILWLFVVNTSNPKVSANVSVAYDVLNEKAIETTNQVYFTNTSTVTISYSVRTKYKNQISADAFSAYINLEDYSVTGAVPVYIEIDSEVSDLISDVTVNPAVIHVTTENIQQKEFEIEKHIKGSPAEGYRVGELSVVPESIYVKGPTSVIGKISSVGITVDVEGATTDLEDITTVEFFDANGSVLSGIEENLSFAGDVSYSLPIYRVKSLTVNAFAGGTPATGFTVDSVETDPTFISVYGPEDLLQLYDNILIPGSDLNITGMRENTTFHVPTEKYIPEGLALATQTPEIAVVVKFRNVFEKIEETTPDVSGGPGVVSELESKSETESNTVQESTLVSTAQSESTSEETSTEESDSSVPESSPESQPEETSETEETSPQGE